jgi:hypothetical protein
VAFSPATQHLILIDEADDQRWPIRRKRAICPDSSIQVVDDIADILLGREQVHRFGEPL